LIYTGIIYKDGTKIPERKPNLLNITVIGYEREFKDYYSL
jgi:hypothetical protein